MKYKILYLLLLVSLGYGVAQEFPVGSWKVNADQTLQQQGATERTRINAKSADSRNKIKQHLESRTYTFKQNGNLELSITQAGKTSIFKGSWRNNNSTLSLKFDNEDKANYTLSKIGNDWLLKLEDAKKEDGIVNNLVLTAKP
jgi:hypothetical protein